MQNGDNKGTVETMVAIKMAMEAGMDLVEISPNVSPPVCKIMDYGKYKYSAQKKAAEARKKQKVVEIKEIKLRPMIDDHDYDVKMRAMQRFFEEGDKVKITLRYRGREMAHQEIGTKLLDKVKADVAEFAKVEQDAQVRRPPGRDGAGAALTAAPIRLENTTARSDQLAGLPCLRYVRVARQVSGLRRSPWDNAVPGTRSLRVSGEMAAPARVRGADRDMDGDGAATV